MEERNALVNDDHVIDVEYSVPTRRTRIAVSGYSSNPNRGSGRRIFDFDITGWHVESLQLVGCGCLHCLGMSYPILLLGHGGRLCQNLADKHRVL